MCLGLEAGLLPVSHRMWGILSGSSKEGRQASKAGGSGQGMERGGQDRGRRQTRPETEPCSGEWPLKFLEFGTFQHELKKHTLYKKLVQIRERFLILDRDVMLWYLKEI